MLIISCHAISAIDSFSFMNIIDTITLPLLADSWPAAAIFFHIEPFSLFFISFHYYWLRLILYAFIS
jgi:hypothetical protein